MGLDRLILSQSCRAPTSSTRVEPCDKILHFFKKPSSGGSRYSLGFGWIQRYAAIFLIVLGEGRRWQDA